MKTIVLRNRSVGQAQWHDVFVLQTAMSAICRGKSLGKNAVSIGIARKIHLAMVEANVGPGQIEGDVTVNLKNSEAKLLWKELQNIRPEDLGRDERGQPTPPNMAILGMMMVELAAGLGQPLEEPDDDEEPES